MDVVKVGDIQDGNAGHCLFAKINSNAIELVPVDVRENDPPTVSNQRPCAGTTDSPCAAGNKGDPHHVLYCDSLADAVASLSNRPADDTPVGCRYDSYSIQRYRGDG